ncbi:PREDICTED: odorant receptor Or2-like [Rhagoletis zephyria]|uniref:odorant receptor Or2-like n=1 Tax=Rhagoletis zephyria TaxID=28612 RepID=UPI00081170D8|nr:PREDICTED: odorant receptor Or2-like [Rhagoletis zephyria]
MLDYQNLELFSVNAKIFLKLRIIGTRSKKRQLLVALEPVLSIFGQILHLFMTRNESISETGLNFFFMAVVLNLVVRLFIVIHNGDKFVRLLRLVANWYHEIERDANPEVLRKLQDVNKHARKLTRISIFAACTGMLFAYTFPFSFDDRKLIVEVSYSFFDTKQSPFYEFFFLLQALVLVPIFCCVYLAFTNLFLAFLMFGEVVLLDLRVRLDSISSSGNKAAMLHELKECIAYHRKIISYRNDLDNLVKVANFFDVALFGLMFCMMLFFMSLVKDIQLVLSAVVFISFPVYVIAISYYYANKFTNESIQICNAAYNTPWYEGNLEMRKCVLIMIARSQRPLYITVMGMYPMTLETFQAIIRISYSYFSLLQGLSQQ